MFPFVVGPEGLLDAPVVRDVLALRVEAVEVDSHLAHSKVAVLVCKQRALQSHRADYRQTFPDG